MYLPRGLISHLYTHLIRSHSALSPPVLVIVSLDPDALCACRILTSLFKRDFIPHNIKPVSGYGDLERAGEELVRPMRTTDGGSGGVVVCLGVGGLVDLETVLGLDIDDQGQGGMGDVDIWLFDSRRPWNLSNVFGIQSRGFAPEGLRPRIPGIERGKVLRNFQPGKGGIVVFDDGDIEEELETERDAYCALAEMPEIGQGGYSDSDSDSDADAIPHSSHKGAKRKSDREESDSEDGSERSKKPKLEPPISGQRLISGDDSDSDPDEGTPREGRSRGSTSPTSPSRQKPRTLAIPSKRRALPGSQFSLLEEQVEKQTKPPSARSLQRQLLQLRRKHDATLQLYYSLGFSYSEPISSLMWNLASELGRDDNDLLWYAIVGMSSMEISGKTYSGLSLSALSSSGRSSSWNGDRGERVRSIFRDEVRRLNPVDVKDFEREGNGDLYGLVQTHARSPTDTSIRLSPEPRLLLVRHWSLYESMLHSPYLSTKLHIWNDSGKRKLHKLLAKMGVSLTQCKQNYAHMDVDVKRGLQEKLVKYAPIYGLEGLVPPEVRGQTRAGWGFVRCWGWKACLSAIDASTILGAILEVGDLDPKIHFIEAARSGCAASASHPSSNLSSGTNTLQIREDPAATATTTAAAQELNRDESILKRFWNAYDSLSSISLLSSYIFPAQHLYRAILRTGTSLIDKRLIKHLRSFRMAVVKDGPDVELFTHPGALIKLALWLGEAIFEIEGLKGRKGGELVMAGLDEGRGVYVVVGVGGGTGVAAMKERQERNTQGREDQKRRREEMRVAKEKRKALRREMMAANGLESDDEALENETESEGSESEGANSDEFEQPARRGEGLNRFGLAFQEVIEETGARVRVDSFEHSVVEVRKEDLSSFLESLCLKTVTG